MVLPPGCSGRTACRRPNDALPFPWEPPPPVAKPAPTGPIDVRKLTLAADEVQGGVFNRDEQGSSYEERPDGSARAVVTFLPQASSQPGNPPQFFSVVDRYADATSAEAALRSLRGNSFQMRALRTFAADNQWDGSGPDAGGADGRSSRSGTPCCWSATRITSSVVAAPPSTCAPPGSGPSAARSCTASACSVRSPWWATTPSGRASPPWMPVSLRRWPTQAASSRLSRLFQPRPRLQSPNLPLL